MRGIDSESRLQVREIQSSGRHGRQLTQRWKDSPPSSDVFSAFPPCKTFECIRSRRSREVADAGILRAVELLMVRLAVRRLSWPPVGPGGRLSILVVGAVGVSGPSSSSADPGGGRSWPIVVGARCVSWGL